MFDAHVQSIWKTSLSAGLDTSKRLHLYVGRRHPLKNRCVIGERKLIASMKKFVEAQENDIHGRPPINGAFRVVNGTALKLVDQIQLFHAASIVIGPHGAGLTNAMFMKKGSVLMEFPVRTYQALQVMSFPPCLT